VIIVILIGCSNKVNKREITAPQIEMDKNKNINIPQAPSFQHIQLP